MVEDKDKLKTTYFATDKLVPDPDNVRNHPQPNHDALARSIRRFGIRKSVVAHESSLIVYAGNETLKVALELGIKEIPVSWIPADVSETVCRAYGAADNQIATLAEWDDDGLADLLKLLEADDDIELDDVGFTLDDLNELLGQDIEVEEDDFDVDEALQHEAVSQLGDIWYLGEHHRLICGDCTDSDIVERVMMEATPLLMVTDPPYGVSYNATWREEYDEFERHSIMPVINDDRCDWTKAWRLFDGDVAYIWHADKFAASLVSQLQECGFEIRSQIIWVKQHFVFSRGDYHWQHEPCWYAVKKGNKSDWSGGRSESTAWQIANTNPMGGNMEEENTKHSTQKPLECMARPIRNHGKQGDIVYDPFLGSGTTMIACEQLGRKCRGIEIEPLYVDVCVNRFVEYVGSSDGVECERDGERITYQELCQV